MAKAFTDEEKIVIYNKLIHLGSEYIARFGFKKTSIEEIAKGVGISKGAFYKFFPSKEIFFFRIMEEIEKEIKGKAMKIIPKDRRNFKEDLINNFFEYLIILKQPEYATFFGCDDYEFIIRGIPEEEIAQHFKKDNQDILDILKGSEDLIDYNNIDIDFVNGIVRTIFLCITHSNQVGEDVIDKVIRAQLEILINHIFNI
jgi:AcrR family transcriptional regulator